MSCFVRHVALAAVGGGWMADYDVVPVHMPPCMSLPNNGRFTTHEKFVPSMCSASGDEYTRVAHLFGNVPWKGASRIFSYEGRPHVSDMLALQYFGSINEISVGDRGCGVVNPSKIFATGQCITCKHGGPPFAIHFAHAVMDNLQLLTARVPLKCAQSKDSHVDWNHWRASCLVEASQALREHCGPQALESAQAKVGGGEVWHKGQNCHAQCAGEPGACAEFCGPGGACCRRGFLDAIDEPECGFGDIGCGTGHCCVALSEADSHHTAVAIKNYLSDGSNLAI